MAESPNEQQPMRQGYRGHAVLITNIDFPLMNCEREAYPGQKMQDPTRKGGDMDDTNLQYIFNTKLKFQLLENKTYKNVNKYPYNKSPNKEQTFWIHETPPIDKSKCRCISCKIQTTDHSQSECFVLAISTHGVQVDREQELCFSDDLHVDRVKLSDIIETLNDENCKTLRGKPRIILLQLCRSDPYVPKDKQDGVWHDKGHLITVASSDEERLKKLKINDDEFRNERGDFSEGRLTEIEDADLYNTEVIDTENREKGDEEDKSNKGQIGNKIFDTQQTDSLKREAEKNDRCIIQEYFYGEEKTIKNLPPDFLIVFPAVSGKKAIHNFYFGSWLIYELRNVVENYDFKENPDMNFLAVLTHAAGRVAREQEDNKGQKTAVCIVHRLLAPLIFKDTEDTFQRQPNLEKDKAAL